MSSAPAPGLPHVDALTPAVLVLPGSVSRGETPRLCDEVRALLERTGAGVVICDVGGLGPGPPGLETVELLARLQLTARRSGGLIRLRAPAPALRALLDLAGLPVEVERQPEQREPPPGVEEAVESGDPAG
ncbi:STAS domain-containing protein [Streptomyces sp. NPDC005876]|uniref:STAS domain-containing protein n=1 Tax=Streptomyces sp. NPDC005876 TaxID=3157076 RepID=UPI0033E14F51